MTYDINIDTQKKYIKNLAKTMKRDELESFVLSHAERAGIDKFKDQAAREIVRMTDPDDVVPDIYSDFKPIVRDGILFLLNRLSSPRLVSIVVDQLLMKESTSVKERLIRLACQVPTLHKLGQIIARNQYVKESFRKWLITLENSLHGTDISSVREQIDAEIGNIIEIYSIRTDNRILAEASVGAVVPFTWSEPYTGRREAGIFKVLKPGVKEKLKEELKILEDLALYFDENRDHYPLKDFRFIETFRDVSIALREEINLSGEQSNLKKASYFYNKDKSVRVPGVLPFSTENITIMEYMKGSKITEAPMSKGGRKKGAKKLFKTLIWYPMFSRDEKTPFHGDPHAGNIYAFEDTKKNGDINLALLDWSQAGFLSKHQRVNIFRLSFGIITGDKELIRDAINELSEGRCERQKVVRVITDIITDRDYTGAQTVKKIFLFIDKAAIKGIWFPTNLLLFRKAFFTLEGIIYDLDPKFDMDSYVFKLIEGLFLEELPKRWMYLLVPQSESSERYKSLLSNTDLQMLVIRFFLKGFEKGTDALSALVDKNTDFLTRLNYNMLSYLGNFTAKQ
ncbi:MAG: hypothetical protein GY795_11810 [Desulfobacterales bacterium]|nr:hypothetical protein [Desulfobacterales bacterium]